MRLIFDGDVPVYSPAAGLNLIPGENEYADDKGEQLVAAGLARKADGMVDGPAHFVGGGAPEHVQITPPKAGRKKVEA